MKKTAKCISKMTLALSKVFVNASSPFTHAPKIPESLKKTK
ncbi:cyclic lactone autoinducer peptide [Caldalkalibacillus uzonensis]|uniref:Cyclic lactone autoinducer peptide n=1 Tax=Caldalkalibacillus uzonensis TaxID=353224 RepID=A0ABU0CVE0_9BACI|nr:cyclic lactone autoinducer peptide [Caldalkalibacillus uzonensis]MDQ0340092.1 cyclic lactone autoinducer peptide [Caldalkalibacillus uzonensis]